MTFGGLGWEWYIRPGVPWFLSGLQCHWLLYPSKVPVEDRSMKHCVAVVHFLLSMVDFSWCLLMGEEITSTGPHWWGASRLLSCWTFTWNCLVRSSSGSGFSIISKMVSVHRNWKEINETILNPLENVTIVQARKCIWNVWFFPLSKPDIVAIKPGSLKEQR